MVKLVFALPVLLLACGPVEQPERLRYVAAVEIDMRTPADRADLLAMLRRHAAAGGLHVDDVSEPAAQNTALPPSERPTIYVGVWRGSADDDLEVTVDDTFHQGRPWIVFSRGARPELAAALREALLRDISRRWPGARRLPIDPSGGLAEERTSPTP